MYRDVERMGMGMLMISAPGRYDVIVKWVAFNEEGESLEKE